jgi:hypothetical protein
MYLLQRAAMNRNLTLDVSSSIRLNPSECGTSVTGSSSERVTDVPWTDRASLDKLSIELVGNGFCSCSRFCR